MILTCNECEWRFKINSALIKNTGSYVKCSICGNLWQVYPEVSEEEALVLESVEEITDVADDQSHLEELYAPAAPASSEPAAYEDPLMEMADLPGLISEPEREEDDFDLPDLEGLIDFEEEELPEGNPLEDPGLIETATEEKNNRDSLDLSDLEDLVESDTPQPAGIFNAEDPGWQDSDLPGLSIPEPEDELPGSLSMATEDSEFGFSNQPGMIEHVDDSLPGPEVEPDEEPKLVMAVDPDSEEGEDSLIVTSTVADDGENEWVNTEISIDAELFCTDTPDNSSEPSIVNEVCVPDSQANTGIATKRPDATEFTSGDPIVSVSPATVLNNRKYNMTAPDKATDASGKAAVKSRGFRMIWILLVVPGIMIAAAFGVKTLFPENIGLRIPLIGDHAYTDNPDTDAGTGMVLLESSVSDRFIENQGAGELFVITGKVKNAGSLPQTGCRVSAELHAKENLVLQTDTVYCGNLLTETELLNLDLKYIIRKLKDPPDPSNSNLAVNPGAAAPFTVVFHNPPEHFDSFRIEVHGDS